jgi:hypothetical protein
MTTLIAGGDSYIYGQELADCEWGVQHSTNTFSALLAKTFDLDYKCTAIPGYSNTAIARSVLNQCLTIKTDRVVLVTWTYTNRFELSTDFPIIQQLEHRSNVWYGISPTNLERNRKDHPEFIGVVDGFLKWTGLTDYYQYYTTLKEILYLQNFLKVHNIPYMFTSADTAICFQNAKEILKHDDNVHTLRNMLDEIDWNHWYLFPHNGVDWLSTSSPNGFRNWALENKFEHGEGKHPLEQAHQAAHDVLQDKFNEMVIQAISKD